MPSKIRSQIGPNGEIYAPTITSNEGFDPEADAEQVHNACKGLGTDEEAIITTLGRKTVEERQEIAAKYKATYGEDMEERLKSELGGKFETLMLTCMCTAETLLARCCYTALHGAGTDETTLTQIIASSTNEEIEAIKEAYLEVVTQKGEDANEHTLEKDIQNDCGGLYGRILVALIQADRNEPSEEDMFAAKTSGVSQLIDRAKAEEDANLLYDSGEGKMGTDEEAFMKVLVRNSVWQLAAIDIAYQNLASKTLLEAIRSELSGDVGEVMETIVECSLDRPAAFAKMLNKAMAGAGTSDDNLIRIISSRAEVDLNSIKSGYQTMYEKPLAEAIKGETSGDYEKLLLTLLGEE